MKIINKLLIVIIALLSIAAGFAKVMLTSQEVHFLESFGFNNIIIVGFGAFQIFAGLLLIVSKSRLYGAVLVLIAFILSSILIIVSGNMIFAIVSFIPVLLTSVIIKTTLPLRRSP